MVSLTLNCGFTDYTVHLSRYLWILSKSQPLERMAIFNYGIKEDKEDANKITYTSEFRSETLKVLEFCEVDCDLSFMLRLERLEQLKFELREGFTCSRCKALPKKK